MPSSITAFSYNGKPFRAQNVAGDVWFVLADACQALGLKAHKGSYAHHADRLGKDEKRLADRAPFIRSVTPGSKVEACSIDKIVGPLVMVGDPLARETAVWLISEGGFYTLLFRSKDALVEGSVPFRFRKWVTSEVLPAIRKTGRYEARPAAPALPANNASHKHSRRIRYAKLALVGAAMRLEELGINAAAIDMGAVVAFGRQLARI